ncbi:MAG: adenosylcobinamide amidohydrolase [Micromonosporaceae bacterium]|nr:adenosylcobinamide amidohydrolase [Micromonosporaceae bacterium]
MSADLVTPGAGAVPAPKGEPYGPALPAIAPEQAFRVEAGRRWPVHVWRFDHPVRAVCSGPYGGGLGERLWVINATVPRDYARLDPDAHIAELATGLGLTGPGAGMLTAVDVGDAVTATDGGVGVVATVGLGYPTLAAAPDDADTGTINPPGGRVGTINVVAFLPVPLSDAALVNAVVTATEAKVQALAGCGFAATGTATDALVVACPVPVRGGMVQPYGGPRSTWGARLARAVHAAVDQGARRWLARRPA